MSASYETFDSREFERILRREFLSEAGDVMDEIEPSILRFEKNPKDSGELDHVFRLLHSFKDSAAVAGFTALADITHKIESLLGAVRTGEIDADESVIEILLMGNDTLRSMVQKLTIDHAATVETKGIEELIVKALGRPTDPKIIKNPILPVSRRMEAEKDQPAVEIERKRILIVDDEPALREVINMILTQEGYDVIEAANGREALAIALKDPTIKLLVTDQSMPIMKGEELVQKLRENNIKVPVIVVTGASDHEAAIKFIRSGVYLYLTKPLDGDDLLLAVRNALRAGELAETLTKALGLTFRNYLRLRRVDSVPQHPSAQQKLEFDMSEDLKTMGELITKVLRKE